MLHISDNQVTHCTLKCGVGCPAVDRAAALICFSARHICNINGESCETKTEKQLQTWAFLGPGMTFTPWQAEFPSLSLSSVFHSRKAFWCCCGTPKQEWYHWKSLAQTSIYIPLPRFVWDGHGLAQSRIYPYSVSA